MVQPEVVETPSVGSEPSALSVELWLYNLESRPGIEPGCNRLGNGSSVH